ncbi:MAG: aminopeptidase P family N-terminal domain-containing protein [Rhodospirillaceae bacterium]
MLAWSEEEVPRDVLDARLARCRAAMADAGLDALLVYTNFPRPSAVSWLTHFVPYWSQGVLTILPEGDPVFTVSLSKRVGNWIEETSCVGEIVCTPNIGRALGEQLTRAGAMKRVGAVELAKLPGDIVVNLKSVADGVALTDATGLFASVRNPADAAEIALTVRAAQIARDALALAAPKGAPVDASILSDIERAARMQGCEEILIDIAEDLSADSRFRRLDGPSVFANRYAVRVSVAYKCHWVRIGRSFEQDGDGRSDAVESRLADPAFLMSGESPDGFEPVDSVVEGCVGTAPLSVLEAPSPGSIVSVTRRWRDSGGYWLVSDPLLLGAAGDPNRRL